jgi:hypothetical protein
MADPFSLISAKVTGGEQVGAMLAAVQRRARDLTDFWIDVFAPQYFAQVQDLFTLEGQVRTSLGTFGPGHWAPLSPEYAAWKARHFPDKGILERTGRLRESVRWDGRALGQDGYFVPGPRSVFFGTDVPYGRFHQDGTKRMPARPFLPTPPPSYWAPMMREWLLARG